MATIPIRPAMCSDKSANLPPATTLTTLLEYDPNTGTLAWKSRDVSLFSASKTKSSIHICRAWNSRWAGKPAFTSLDTHGYLHGSIFGVLYLAHRIIWKMVFGVEPNVIDHIDGDRSNNIISNLRDVTNTENARNQPLRKRNATGVPDVFYHKGKSKYFVRISVGGRRMWVGTFSSLDEAIDARISAQSKAGYHENHGRSADE